MEWLEALDLLDPQDIASSVKHSGCKPMLADKRKDKWTAIYSTMDDRNFYKTSSMHLMTNFKPFTAEVVTIYQIVWLSFLFIVIKHIHSDEHVTSLYFNHHTVGSLFIG